MKLLFTKPFVKDYHSLPQEIQNKTDKQLEFLLTNIRHPSLRSKKMEDPRNIWEARITKGYRFTFQIQDEIYILRRIGNHDILRNP